MILRTARRIAVAVVGASVTAIGVAMIVLPGPAFVVIPAGLAILALEFTWAQRWLERVKQYGERAVNSVRGERPPNP
jgi:tellurite resistance protein TerC